MSTGKTDKYSVGTFIAFYSIFIGLTWTTRHQKKAIKKRLIGSLLQNLPSFPFSFYLFFFFFVHVKKGTSTRGTNCGQIETQIVCVKNEPLISNSNHIRVVCKMLTIRQR